MAKEPKQKEENYEVVVSKLAVVDGKVVVIPQKKRCRFYKTALKFIEKRTVDKEGEDTGEWEIVGVKSLTSRKVMNESLKSASEVASTIATAEKAGSEEPAH